MDHPELAFGEDGEFVSVWVGAFGDQHAVDAYTKEQYGEDRDDEPISKFGADIGVKFYDHDFMEVEHCLGLSGLGLPAFARHSWGESFGEAAWRASQGLMLYGYDHVRYPQASRKPERVTFVGVFPYTKPRNEWFERLIAGEFDDPKSGGS
jgi:hypothetical protein